MFLPVFYKQHKCYTAFLLYLVNNPKTKSKPKPYLPAVIVNVSFYINTNSTSTFIQNCKLGFMIK